MDTFNGCFEKENADAAVSVLTAAGYRVHVPEALDGPRPLCCGRTFISNGLLDEAKSEIRRTIAALWPFVERGVPVIGIEPSCLLTLRDEYQALLPGEQSDGLAENTWLLEEFLLSEMQAERLNLALRPLAQSRALVHGHCHQKAFGALTPVRQILALIPGLEVEMIDSSCCGMAGSFGFEAEHYDASMAMAELSLLPSLEKVDADTLVVADGTSCRSQILHGAGHRALHVARVLQMALDS